MKYLYLVITICSLVLLMFSLNRIEKERNKSVIYFIGMEHYYCIDSSEMYVFKYTIDGHYYEPVFNTTEEIDQFKGYLSNLGIVIGEER